MKKGPAGGGLKRAKPPRLCPLEGEQLKVLGDLGGLQRQRQCQVRHWGTAGHMGCWMEMPLLVAVRW